MHTKKKIAIIGSTGSIGTQALEVIAHHNDRFEVEVITANTQSDLLIEQAIRYKPNSVVIADKSEYNKVNDALFPEGIKVFAGSESIEDIVEMDSIDMVIMALVGFSGLMPTINAIKAKKPIALANKETLVVAGEYITRLAAENNVPIIPVDSEHSAIFQCISGEFNNPIEKVILTASGGPFRGWTKERIEKATVEEALNHPNWVMGKKITIDSATLMNKGLEVIEAKWLFGLESKQIRTIIHPQSIIHSMVEFEDGSLKAQLGLADMRLPIQYAISYPQRLKSNYPKFSIIDHPNLSFEPADREVFRCLDLAYYAMEKSGNMPTILNAANEIAVQAFLDKKIRFLDIADLIEESMAKYNFIENPNVNDCFETDRTVRESIREKLNYKKE